MKKALLLSIAITTQLQSAELPTIQYKTIQYQSVATNVEPFILKIPLNVSTNKTTKLPLTIAQKVKRVQMVARELEALNCTIQEYSTPQEDRSKELARLQIVDRLEERLAVLGTGEENAFKQYLRFLRINNWNTIALQKPSFKQFLKRYRANKKIVRAAQPDMVAAQLAAESERIYQLYKNMPVPVIKPW